MTEALLAVNAVSKQFLGLRAVDDVSLVVQRGEIVSIAGGPGSSDQFLHRLAAVGHEELRTAGEVGEQPGRLGVGGGVAAARR